MFGAVIPPLLPFRRKFTKADAKKYAFVCLAYALFLQATVIKTNGRMLGIKLILHFSVITCLAFAKHVYIPLNEELCFYENLEQEHILNGKMHIQFKMPDIIKNELGMKYNLNLDVRILETFDENHVVYSQNYKFLSDSQDNEVYYQENRDEQGSLSNKNGINYFTFTALENGEHAVCIKPSVPNFNPRRLRKEGFSDKVKVYIDFEVSSLGKIMDVISQHDSKFLLSSKIKVNSIISKLKIIKLEQIKFREKYHVFLKISDSTNSRIITWGVVQVVWITLICMYELNFLKQFFIKQKVM